MLVNLGKKITDFGSDAVNALNVVTNEEQIDETYGINVQFEESEEESDNDMYGEIRDEDGQDEGEEARIDHTLHSENVSAMLDYRIVLCKIICCLFYMFPVYSESYQRILILIFLKLQLVTDETSNVKK